MTSPSVVPLGWGTNGTEAPCFGVGLGSQLGARMKRAITRSGPVPATVEDRHVSREVGQPSRRIRVLTREHGHRPPDRLLPDYRDLVAAGATTLARGKVRAVATQPPTIVSAPGSAGGIAGLDVPRGTLRGVQV